MKRPPLSLRIRRRLGLATRRGWPWLLWIAAIGAALWLQRDLGGFVGTPGAAESREVMLGAPQPARVASVQVAPGQEVAAGQVLATLDTSLLDAEIRVVEAEIRRLEGELRRQAMSQQGQQLEQSRRFATDAQQVGRALAEARGTRARSQAELDELDAEIARQETLVRGQLAPADRLQELRVRRAAAAAEVVGQDRLIRLLQQQARDSLSRLSRWKGLAVEGPEAPGAKAGARSTPAGSPPAATPGDEATSGLTALLAPVQAAIEVAERRLDRLEVERTSRSLVAPVAGRVASVLLRPGAMAGPGAPVLSLVPARTDRVVAYVAERDALRVHPGQQALLKPRDRSGPAVRAQVESLAPRVAELPRRFWTAPNRPTWGREARLKVQGSDARRLLPGQAFDVTFLPRDALSGEPRPAPPLSIHREGGLGGVRLGEAALAGVRSDEAPAPAAARSQGGKHPSAAPPPGSAGDISATPAPIHVPKALDSASVLEPSGLLWMPEWKRFLVVSDDTGRDGTDHAPWVFAMDAQGRMDAAPVVVASVDELNDLEAVARGDRGVFLLSSQSASYRGRRPATREQLLRAEPTAGRGLRVTGGTHLLAAIVKAADGAGGKAWLAGLGLTQHIKPMTRYGPDGTDLLLDIEGLAFVDGALLLGLKEPAAPEGALLWRLARPDRLLDGQPLARADLTVVARIPLRVEHAGRTLNLGVSGLHPLSDGALALTATYAGDELDFGSLWRVSTVAPGRMEPHLLRAYPGLKPEGVASGPDGALVLVFDRGNDPPLWQTLRP